MDWGYFIIYGPIFWTQWILYVVRIDINKESYITTNDPGH